MLYTIYNSVFGDRPYSKTAPTPTEPSYCKPETPDHIPSAGAEPSTQKPQTLARPVGPNVGFPHRAEGVEGMEGIRQWLIPFIPSAGAEPIRQEGRGEERRRGELISLF
jgi:hypothetical protein